ncbi:MAG: NAD(P)H-dependent oxidoreductase [Bdellovibrionota bacterium]
MDNSVSQSHIQEALDWRYATKRFDPKKKISEKDWQVLTDSLQQAPSSYGLQPWKFLVIENPALRNKLKSVSWDQTQVTDASHYVVFLYKEKLDEEHIQKYIERIADVRNVPLGTLDSYKKMMIENLIQGPRSLTIDSWAQRQAYIAMGFLLETAALLKVDATPMEGLDPKAYDEILNLKNSGWRTVATVALGYRHPEDNYQNLKKVRFRQEDIIEYVK